MTLSPIPLSRNSTRAGSSTARSVPSSVPTATGRITSCGAFDKVEPILVSYDKLRYRLMPYIYSLAWKVTSEDYTIQRPLVMDWRTDPKTWNLGDQFMFGPACWSTRCSRPTLARRSVYLPAAAAWYDFWTGKSLTGGQEIEADAPLDRMPLFVRAGSIVPMGPQIEYATQDPAGPIELRIYRGADGKFDLYEDAGDGYEYEKGQHSVIPIRWDDRSSLTHDRLAARLISRNDRTPQIPRRPGHKRTWHRLGCDQRSQLGNQLRWQRS